ncbi:hypothetical protein FZC84_14780 [Rossellomorea vietnamensis]|uniref:Uncharacterized protein n=1 Tax=Rossellomorea vietnamensis TaxID=218284 RepID=A0A5D4M9W7_9BACI|nr:MULTISPECIES: hypothetical protein [Bacillaceae]TYR98436.1 hypothetical protein FZC84_14780 [Rossellomorea vietnamensis]
MKKWILLLVIICLAGCREDMPEPESFGMEHEAEAAMLNAQKKTDITVKHIVQGSQVYVECIVPGVTFSTGKKGKKGKIVVSVDGKRHDEYHTAAFVIKGLTKGIHHVKLDIVEKKSRQSLGLQKQFYITIP